MQVWMQRVVFGMEIRAFGLEEREIREVANSVIKDYSEWDINDIKSGRNGHIELYLEYNYKETIIDGELFEGIKHLAKTIAKEIEEHLKIYKAQKRYFEIYNNCNGHNGRTSEAKEIMRKVGIPVIS